MISTTENKSKNRMREKKMTITPYFTWKTSKNILKKKHEPTTNRKYLL